MATAKRRRLRAYILSAIVGLLIIPLIWGVLLYESWVSYPAGNRSSMNILTLNGGIFSVRASFEDYDAKRRREMAEFLNARGAIPLHLVGLPHYRGPAVTILIAPEYTGAHQYQLAIPLPK
ncbi:hypothetical protein ACXR0O_25400 [Verrucomicrobiota bacterium sgz303538]